MNVKLLSLLEENARYSLEELALMLGSDEKTVAGEIDELRNSGVIRGYRTLINWDKVDNAHVTAIIELKLTPQPDAGFEDLAKKIMRFDHVESVYLMSGGYDLCVIVTGQSFQGVAMFVAKRLAPIAGVVLRQPILFYASIKITVSKCKTPNMMIGRAFPSNGL